MYREELREYTHKTLPGESGDVGGGAMSAMVIASTIDKEDDINRAFLHSD